MGWQEVCGGETKGASSGKQEIGCDLSHTMYLCVIGFGFTPSK